MHHHNRRKFWFLIPVVVAAVLALAAWAVQSLWNGVLAEVVGGVKTITYWQALGLFVLAKILFGGFPGKRGGRCGPKWKHRMMKEHWQSLTAEQREQMREQMRRRFGDWPRPPWCAPEDGKAGEEKPADAPKP